MASKKYKNHRCVYCLESRSEVGDHVFAREFFMPERRGNLPKAPSCNKCNFEKSKLEQYLTTLLPFGGRHEDAHSNLVKHVPARLSRNKRLFREIAKGRGKVWVNENGIFQQAIAFKVDSQSVISLFDYIARGLVWHHFGAYLTRKDLVDVLMLTEAGEIFFEDHYFSLNVAQRVQGNLGNGTIRYEGVQGFDCEQVTAWRITMYGGLLFVEDPTKPDLTGSKVGIITGPLEG